MKKLMGIIISVMVCFAGFVFTACTPNYDNLSVSPSTEKIVLAVNETQKVHFQFENTPSGFIPNIQLNNTNSLISVIPGGVEDNTVFFEIKGLKSGKTTVNALSFEGNKSCSFDVEVYEEITGFEARDNLFVVAEDGNRYVLKNQSYFTFLPQSCKTPEIRYTYSDIEVTEIIGQKDNLTNNTYIKFVGADGQILTDAQGQDIKFLQGNIILTAEVLDYTTSEPISNISAKELTLQIVPKIESGNLKLLRKGGILSDATKYYTEDNIITSENTLTLIKNRISDSYFVFEVECDTQDVTMEIESNLFTCTQIAANDASELEGYISSHPSSKFFSVQAKDVGKETIKITLKYTPSTSFGQTGYEKTYELNFVAITAPYQVNTNNVQEYLTPITVFNNSLTPYELYINVLDKVSSFEGVRVSLCTKTLEGQFIPNEELFEYLGVSYGNLGSQTKEFVVPYSTFSNNSSMYPLKITAKKKTTETIYVVLTVLPPIVEGAEKLKEDVKIAVPFEVYEGIQSFTLSNEFLQQIGSNITPKTLYLDINSELVEFDGFVISNLETATLSNFKYEYFFGEDVVGLEQVVVGGVLTKKLTISPKKVGTAKVRVIAQEGFYVDLTFSVLDQLNGANLVLTPSENVTSTKQDESGNVAEIQVAHKDDNNLIFNIVKENISAGLYLINTQVNNTNVIDVANVLGEQISVKLVGVSDEAAVLTVRIIRQEVKNFALIEKQNDNIVFEVKINVYSPVSSMQFVLSEKQDDKPAYTPVSGLSVYRQIDVGYKYAMLSEADCEIRIILANGEVVENAIAYYDSLNALSVSTSYGALVDRGDHFFINQFGSMQVTDDKLIFNCNYEAAQTGSFMFALTIKDHNVTYTQSLVITVKTFKALEYVGITNYQEQIYLSGTNNSFTFFTYTDNEADIDKFDVVFEPINQESANLVVTSVSADGSQVLVQHNSAVSAGSGYLYFVPRTMFIEGEKFPHDRVQKVKVIYSDGNNKKYPELISNAEEFMSAITDTGNIAKHYVILSTIDLNGYSFENVKPLTGSISGGSQAAKLINVNIKINSTSYSINNIGLFPKIETTGELNNLVIEGSINIDIGNLGESKTYNIGLIAGENMGSINNVSVRLTSANVTLKDNAASNKVYVGGVFGTNSGNILNAVSTNQGKDNLIFGFDDTKINLTSLSMTGTFFAKYQGKSQDAAFGGICGQNNGRIERLDTEFVVFNNNIFTEIISINSSGFEFTGAVAGQNGSIDNSAAQIEGRTVNANVLSQVTLNKGGQKVGLITGQNFANIANCMVTGSASGYDYIGGLMGYDYSPQTVHGNSVMAIKTADIKPMLTAITNDGHVGAFSGNSNQAYVQNQNKANCYYVINTQNKQAPMAYNLQLNGNYSIFSGAGFTQVDDAVEVLSINTQSGAFGFDVVSGVSKNQLAGMFFYEADNPNQQSIINYKNTNRNLPFIFSAGTLISVTSLTPEILAVDTFGNVTIYKTGMATLKVSSVLDSSKSLNVYVYVVNAFETLTLENLAGEEIASGAYVNVYALEPASIKFSFRHPSILAEGNMGVMENVALKTCQALDINISYEGNQYYYTTAEKYGNVIILTSTNQADGINRVDKITVSPVLALNLSVLGVNISAEVINFSAISTKLKPSNIEVLSVLGTTSLTASASNIIVEPVDEISLTITQTTDDALDTLTLSSEKMIETNPHNNNYFKILSQNKTQTFNSETQMFEIVYNYTIKYDYQSFGDDYEGIYYLTFSARNGKEKIVVAQLQTQTISSVTLKNYYDVQTEYNPVNTQNQNVSSGDYNLLEINLYPYYANYDYILIHNDIENYDKNNVLLMEVMMLQNGSETKLEFFKGALYEDSGIKITKKSLENQNVLLGESARLFVRYTTISQAAVDTVSKLVIEVYNSQEIVYQTLMPLNIVVKDSVFFTINNRQIASEYYLAKGLTYNLTLNTYGFTEDQAKIEITHEGVKTNAVSISKTKQGEYLLTISSNITYSAAAQNTQGFEVEIKTYGENIVDGIKYQSGKSTLKIIVVDFVVLQSNIAAYSITDNIDEFTYFTSIKNSNGAVVGIPVGSAYALQNAFVQNQTIEFDAQNLETVKKVQSFESALTNLGEWTITSLNQQNPILGKFVTHHTFENNTSLVSDYLKINGKTITPLRINAYTDPNYYLTYQGTYYYQFGEAVFGAFGTTFNLSTDFVLDVYPNSNQDNPIPVTSYQEFIAMQNNAHYILMQDIVLPQNFTPIAALVASFDGNGHKIILPSVLGITSTVNTGIFEHVGENSVLKNIILYVDNASSIVLNNENAGTISFGVLVGTNNGSITNCSVQGTRYGHISVSLPNQTAQNLDNYVAGLVGENNGFITNSYVSINLSAATNIAGLVGQNNGKIASCFVKDSMIINKSSFSSSHKTAGLVIRNGITGSETAQIIASYVSGSTSTSAIYSVNTEKSINSMPPVSGFVFTNHSKIIDCYSDIIINTSSTSAGFVFENSGTVTRCYTTSTFSGAGLDAYIFVKSNQIAGGQIGEYENCFYLVGDVNSTAAIQALKGLTALDDSDFSDPKLFEAYAMSSNFNKLEGVWFYPSKEVETAFKNGESNMKFTYGRPELVSANTIAYTQKVLNPNQTSVNPETGETIYAYTETRASEGSTFNPILISSAQEFETFIKNNSTKNINSLNYRIIADINYQKEQIYVASTHNITFTGTLEGNGMEILGFSIDYRAKTNSAGLFAQIGQGTAQNGIVRNLTITPSYLNLPNASCAGTLAGKLESGRIFNICVNGTENTSSFVTIIGQNAVGGVIGFASGGFKMKNIESSVSANASYNYKKSSRSYTPYQTQSNLSNASYAGAICGIATAVGEIYAVKALENVTVIAENSGLLIGLVGNSVVVTNISQNISQTHTVIASVYGGSVFGVVYGEVNNVTVSGQPNQDFIKKADNLTNAVAVGGLAGLLAGGVVSDSAVSASFEWKNSVPKIVGGVVGEMVGGTISNTKFTGEYLSVNLSNTNFSLTEIITGALVGKMSSHLSAQTNINLTAQDNTLEYIETTGTINVKLVNIHTVYVGGVVGQVIQEYSKDDTVDSKTLPRYQNIFNAVNNKTNINTSNIIYGGVLNTYVGGIIGGVHTDSGNLYAGEVVMYDSATEKVLEGKYQSTSTSTISVSVIDNESTGMVTTYFGGVIGYGYAVKQHTIVKGQYDSRNNPWGKLLFESLLETPNNQTSPEFAGKWQDEENKTWADFLDTDYMSINVTSPIITTSPANNHENALKKSSLNLLD